MDRFDYSLAGEEVMTPSGKGQYLSHKNGKVLVIMAYDYPPCEYDSNEVFICLS